MEEYFLKKCVTSERFQDATTSKSSSGNGTNGIGINSNSDHSVAATRDTVLHPCELVLIQECQAAHGASRALWTKAVSLLLQSSKTERVVVITLESVLCTSAFAKHENKLVHVDFSSNLALWQRLLLPAATDTSLPQEDLLTTLLQQIQQLTSKFKQPTNSNASKAPFVIVLDAVHVLFQLFPVLNVRNLLLQLRKLQLVGSIVGRLNLQCVSKSAAVSMTSLATAVLQIETKTSLESYPLLSNERKRSLPKEADGLLLLCRQKKNGTTKQHIEYFQFSTKGLRIFSSKQAASAQASTAGSAATATSTSTSASATSAGIAGAPSPATRAHAAASLPVDPKRVTFNLSISEEEQKAKSQVQLPFQQAAHPQQPPKQLFFIDPDDPDWDDDDLDDDLDI